MSKDISFFNDYHKKENSVTNYCGLMLKMVYEESPSQFEEILTALTSNDIQLQVGPSFRQQVRFDKSIPDLAIIQNSFSIFFENKLSDWFYSEQLQRHMASIGSSERTVLFLMTNFESLNNGNVISEIEKANKDGLIVKCITFEDLVGSLEKINKSNYLENMLNSFKTYLDGNDLLPRWRYMLDVVNCVDTMDEITDSVYICPDTGGSYSHRRAKYFGPYSNKTVSFIYEIEAVASIGINLKENRIKWLDPSKYTNKNDEMKLIKIATNHIKNKPNRLNENTHTPLQVFLLSNGYKTNFYKSTSGGMQQSKIYFWDIARDVNSSEELSNKLLNKKWDEYR